MSVQGKTLRSQAQQLICNLLDYFEREKTNGAPLLPLSCVQQRVADAMGINLSSVQRIKSRSKNSSILSSPGKKRRRRKTKSEDLPDSSKMVVRQTLYNMYAEKKHVTIASLNGELKEFHILVSNTSLNRALHNIGFKFMKDDNRRALTEKTTIANMLLQFLRGYMEHLNSPLGRQVIFMDETWIFSKGNPRRSWQDEDTRSGRKPEGYDGKRFIVVHAGSKSGFVENASLLFASKSQKEDYHGEMNGEMFKKWLTTQLIKKLEEPSLIIMDNAPYHSTLIEKMPSSAWTEPNIAAWLTGNNIPFSPSLHKVELLTLAKLHRKEKRYVVDELIRSCGHEVLRLPPYHCEFNAIEMIWAHAKSYYNTHIGRDGYGDDKVVAMWTESLQQCTPTVWENCIRHTEDLIKKWYEREKSLDLNVNEIVIPVNNSTDSSSDDSDKSD